MASKGANGSENHDSVYQNVQVVVRMRPLNEAEKKDSHRIAGVKMDTVHNEILIDNTDMSKTSIPKNKKFTFDRVFDSSTSQVHLFETSVAPVVEEVLRGYSCCIFAYGQTGTGKTYTMEGARSKEDGTFDADVEDAGIIPRAVKRVFKHLEKKADMEPGFESVVKISFLEIYNEKLDDLLCPEASTFQELGTTGTLNFKSTSRLPGFDNDDEKEPNIAGRDRLKIVSDEKMGMRVAGLEEIPVKTAKECFNFIQRGIAKRATAETKCNAQSSRSHCVFTLTITMKENFDGEDMLRVGKLNLVDLAGSECIGRSGATDRRAREAGNINQSLLTLGRVITALVDKMPHVPYRDSKLTRLLQDSLGGKTKTCIIATIGPSPAALEETMSTLEYANRAKNIKNRPEASMRVEKRDVMAAAFMELEKLRARFRQQIESQGNLISIPLEELDGLNARITQLEQELEAAHAKGQITEAELTDVREILVDTKQELESTRITLQKRTEELAATQHELEQEKGRLEQEKHDHESTKVIVKTYKNNELALTKEAQLTKNNLIEAVKDLEGMHSKRHRMDQAVTHNFQRVSSFVEKSEETMDGLNNVVVSSLSDIAFSANSLKNSSMSFHDSLKKLHADHSSAVSKLKSDLSAFVKNSTTILQTAASDIMNLSSTNREISGNSLQSTLDSLDTGSKSIVEIVKLLSKYAEEQEEKAKVFNESIDHSIKESNEMTTSFVRNLLDQTESTVQFLGMRLKDAESRATVAEKKLETLQEQYEAFVMKQKSAFISSLQSAADSWALSIVDESKKNILSLEKDMKNELLQTSSTINDMEQRVCEMKSTVTRFSGNFSSHSITSQAEQNDMYQSLISAHMNTSSIPSKLEVTLRGLQDSVTATSKAHDEAFAHYCDAVVKSVNTSTFKQRSENVSISGLQAKCSESLSITHSQAMSESVTFTGLVESTMDSIASTTERTEKVAVATAHEHVQSIQGLLESTQTAEGLVTGSTPAKRGFQAPEGYETVTDAAEVVDKYWQLRGRGLQEEAAAAAWLERKRQPLVAVGAETVVQPLSPGLTASAVQSEGSVPANSQLGMVSQSEISEELTPADTGLEDPSQLVQETEDAEEAVVELELVEDIPEDDSESVVSVGSSASSALSSSSAARGRGSVVGFSHPSTNTKKAKLSTGSVSSSVSSASNQSSNSQSKRVRSESLQRPAALVSKISRSDATTTASMPTPTPSSLHIPPPPSAITSTHSGSSSANTPATSSITPAEATPSRAARGPAHTPNVKGSLATRIVKAHTGSGAASAQVPHSPMIRTNSAGLLHGQSANSENLAPQTTSSKSNSHMIKSKPAVPLTSRRPLAK